jgi:hypothetical protein
LPALGLSRDILVGRSRTKPPAERPPADDDEIQVITTIVPE